MSDGSHIRTREDLAIFLAALQGFIANKDFHGPVSQGSPAAAVQFASEVVKVTQGKEPTP